MLNFNILLKKKKNMQFALLFLPLDIDFLFFAHDKACSSRRLR